MWKREDTMKVTAAADRITGTRYCHSCMKHRPVSSFKARSTREKCQVCRDRIADVQAGRKKKKK